MLVKIVRMAGRLVVRNDWDLVRSTLFYEWQQLKKKPDITPPLIVQRLLISGEDHRHARHVGYDLYAICRAIWRRVSKRSREGASTIEQQLVRVITNRYEKTFLRKVREIALASLVAESFPKKILPIIYLHLGYFGWRMNGYSQACNRLRLSNETITLKNAARLVARLKYPEPKLTPPLRMLQIERRTIHLQILYQKHLLDGTYEYDNSEAFRGRYSFKRLVRAIS